MIFPFTLFLLLLQVTLTPSLLLLQVAVPRLFSGLVSPSVLVESFESGHSVAHFTKVRTPINTQIVSLGVDAYLAMLLK